MTFVLYQETQALEKRHLELFVVGFKSSFEYGVTKIRLPLKLSSSVLCVVKLCKNFLIANNFWRNNHVNRRIGWPVGHTQNVDSQIDRPAFVPAKYYTTFQIYFFINENRNTHFVTFSKWCLKATLMSLLNSMSLNIPSSFEVKP